jgi:cupin fold WbuC family metalloprotein
MKITKAILDDLTAKAIESPKLRMNYDLRNSAEDQSQRMLNAIEPESVVPIHRHQKSSETVVCLRGRVVEEYYQEVQGSGFKVQGVQEPKAELVERIELSPNGQVVALNIPAGQWHTVRALESGSVILEMKEGAYEPIQDCDVLKM